MHLEDEQIQRLLHGELDPRAEAAVIGHSVTCDECRVRLEEAKHEEKQIFELLRRLDHSAPGIDAAAIATRARGGMEVEMSDRAIDHPADRSRAGLSTGSRTSVGKRAAVGSGAARSWRLWAAGMLLAAAAGVAYAAPGSPLPALVRRVVESIGVRAPRRAPIAPSTPAMPGSAGIAVAPSERFVIHFESAQPRGVAAVSLTDGTDITARASSGAATFTSDIDRLTIENGGSTADYEIDIPRDAPWVEIRVGSRRLLLERAGRVVSDVRADARGRYILPLTRAGK